MKLNDLTLPLGFADELIIDNFAGGGGTSEGLERAFGRPVDIAINHDPVALAMHALNHPYTRHLCESVWDVDPIKVTKNQPVGLVWLSPDCKHFSKAKGSMPVDKKIRGLAWVALRWAALCKPRVIILENVEEFKTWGPVILTPKGPLPDPARRGHTFNSFVWQLKKQGYKVEYRELRASDHDTGTIRKRFFMVARRDGLPIVWPAATHGNPADAEFLTKNLQPWRTAAQCINFNEPSTSIFARKKSLVDNTLRRIVKGAWRYVIDSPTPYVVHAAEAFARQCKRSANDEEFHHGALHHVDQGAHEHAADTVSAYFIDRPSAELGSQNGIRRARSPLSTSTENGRSTYTIGSFMEQANGGFYDGDGRSLHEPLSTIMGRGTNQRLISAYFIKYYGEGGQWQGADEPMHTLTTKARMGLVQVAKVPAGVLDEKTFARAKACALLFHRFMPELFPEPADLLIVRGVVLVDISLRMLTPRELYRAQGFPEDYIINEIPNPDSLFREGKQVPGDPRLLPRIPLTKTAQIRMCGNSVCPPVAEVLASGNFTHEKRIRKLAS